MARTARPSALLQCTIYLRAIPGTLRRWKGSRGLDANNWTFGGTHVVYTAAVAVDLATASAILASLAAACELVEAKAVALLASVPSRGFHSGGSGVGLVAHLDGPLPASVAGGRGHRSQGVRS